jgi:hypothetical protein
MQQQVYLLNNNGKLLLHRENEYLSMQKRSMQKEMEAEIKLESYL